MTTQLTTTPVITPVKDHNVVSDYRIYTQSRATTLKIEENSTLAIPSGVNADVDTVRGLGSVEVQNGGALVVRYFEVGLKILDLVRSTSSVIKYPLQYL